MIIQVGGSDVSDIVSEHLDRLSKENHDLLAQGRLQTELAALKPWYDLGRRRRQGRTLVGVSELSINENLQKLGELLDAEALQTPDLRWFKLAIEDVKAFYIEALTAQPGEHAHQQIQNTLWQETQFGAGLALFYQWFQAHPKLSLFARLVASREAIGGTTSEEIEGK